MKRLSLLTSLLLVAACTPDIPLNPPPSQVHALFDPATSPPTVPSPNSLAINPQTGKVQLPLPPNPSEADVELATFLATLDGFPADTPGQASFDGQLQADTVNPTNVRVLDVTAGNVPVSGYTVVIAATPPPGAASAITITPPVGGWAPGHEFAVVLVGGNNGLKGANGQPVIGSGIWTLVRTSNPLVTCSDLTSPDCRSVTGLLTTPQALQLEQLRRMFQPLFAGLEAAGLPRGDVPLAWTFKTSSTTVMAFQPSASPPEVPSPNDIAIDPATGTLNLPIDPSTSAANQAFVRDFLNTLNGFPESTPGSAPVAGGQLAPASVNATTVRVIDITPSGDGGTTGTPVDAPVAWNPAANAISITPPTGGWPRGHHFAVVVIDGPTGVRSASGGDVGPSSIWVLVRGPAPLASCANPNDPSCTSNLTVVPVTNAQAAQLEALRQGLQPLLASLAAQGLPPEAIPIAWTFRIVSNPEAEFDPANQVIPFPNNLLLSVPADGGTPHVALPVPDGGSPTTAALIAGLNTLDGFSTTAPLISENSDTLPPLTNGALIDPASLDGGTGFVRLAPSSNPNVLQTEPQVTACVSCVSSPLPDGGTQIANGTPEQLQFVPTVPLDEQTTFAAFVTTGLKAQGGVNVVATPTFALVRSPEPLVDASGHSTISGVTDAQAAAAEPLRQALKPMFDALEAQGIPRRDLALAWAFTTQSTVSQLAQLRGLPAAIPLPDTPIAFAPAPGVTPGPNESAVFDGELITAFALTGPGGTLNPSAPTPIPLPFVLVLPKSAPPSGGFPVAIFGHGLGRDRNDVLLLADTLAASGIASIAIDDVWHGERTSCTGSAAVLAAAGVPGATDDFACGGPGAAPNPVAQRCDEATPIGRCVARTGSGDACTFLSPTAATDGTGGDLFCASVGQGRCRPTAGGAPGPSTCEGGDFWRPGAGQPPVISGWNIFNTSNLFVTRDNLRQQVIDFAQLVRVIQASGTGSLNELLTAAGATGTLNGGRIQFVGQSLGSILGSLFNAVSPDTHRLALNVPAGDLPQIFLTSQSPSLVQARGAFLASLASQGIVPGTPQFDSFIGFTHWILDPADPVNAGVYLAKGNYIPGDRQAFIQFIEGDQTLPNPTTQELIAATIRPGQNTCAANPSPPCADVFEFTDQQFGSVLPPLESRHGFLLNQVSPTATSDAQNQVVQFLTQGTVKTTFP